MCSINYPSAFSPFPSGPPPGQIVQTTRTYCLSIPRKVFNFDESSGAFSGAAEATVAAVVVLPSDATAPSWLLDMAEPIEEGGLGGSNTEEAPEDEDAMECGPISW